MSNLSTKLRESLLEKGACMVDYADVSDLSYEVMEGLKNAISIAVALNPSIICEISKGPTIKYYQEYNRANNLLSDLCGHAVEILKTEGHQAVALEPTIKVVDLSNIDEHLPHKTVATKAGLGWIGKSALLITKKYGAAIRLASVLTDAELDIAIPIEQSMCGDCRQCVDHCPAKAIKGNNWVMGSSRDSIYDAFACCETAKNLSQRAGIQSPLGRVVICGICINVCPWTQKYISLEEKTEKSRMLKILPAQTDEDFKAAKNLFIKYADSLGFDLSFQGFEEELANLPGDYVRPAGCLLLAVYKEQTVGCVGLRKLSDGVCEMKRLYVKEKFRSLGIGKALAEAVIEQARKIGYKYMRLDTIASMYAARALYVSIGFKQTSPYRYNPIQDAVFMELKLV